jgi:hypothetical protein
MNLYLFADMANAESSLLSSSPYRPAYRIGVFATPSVTDTIDLTLNNGYTDSKKES